jgi:hypothetical protein
MPETATCKWRSKHKESRGRKQLEKIKTNPLDHYSTQKLHTGKLLSCSNQIKIEIYEHE